ncbi:MAG: DUF433 domain-containing protein [Chloroflexota bacterium]
MKVRVEHPYITAKEGICGGSPVVKGTRIPVWALIGYHKDLNYSIEDILKQLPDLTPAQIYDAFSFYYDHQKEIDQELKSNTDEEYWRKEGLMDEN